MSVGSMDRDVEVLDDETSWIVLGGDRDPCGTKAAALLTVIARAAERIVELSMVLDSE